MKPDPNVPSGIDADQIPLIFKGCTAPMAIFLPFDKTLFLSYLSLHRFEYKRGNCDAKTGTRPQGRAA
jgi:hypothetical protein